MKQWTFNRSNARIEVLVKDAQDMCGGYRIGTVSRVCQGYSRGKWFGTCTTASGLCCAGAWTDSLLFNGGPVLFETMEQAGEAVYQEHLRRRRQTTQK